MIDNVRHSIMNEVVFNTDDFMASIPKSKRKKFGQFFTTASVAKFMSRLFNIDLQKSEMRLLDAGAGTGILCIALIEHIYELGYSGKIELICYETDLSVLPILKKNLTLAKKHMIYLSK